MAHDAMRILFSESESQQSIAGVFIGRYQIHFATHGGTNETIERCCIRVFDHFANDVALARDRADHGRLVAVMMTGSILALVGVSVLVLPADVRLVNLDDAHKLLEVIVLHSGAQTMANVPSGMQRRSIAEIHSPDLARRNTLQALQHRVENFEPRHERDVRILEHGADQNGESIGRIAALLTDPMKASRFEGVDLLIPAARAFDTIRPAAIREKLTAGYFVGKGCHELLEGHHA